ncbi:hypothetical protein CPB86DRAFT_360291 [Serendipita vermifera]|nr:hypothetical protein CPB86DRAFT_360291 [Serendipita vermifera]
MSECYQELGEALKSHEQCRAAATSVSSVRELQTWHDHKTIGYIKDLSEQDIKSFPLPTANKSYRESILRQQRSAVEASQRHNSTLLRQLDTHQQHSEDVKSLIKRIEIEYNNLSTKLVTHLSHARDELYTFSSFNFISKARESHEMEMGHISMEPVTYIDFVTGEPSPTVVLGTETEAAIMRHATSLMAVRKLSLNVCLLSDRK